MVRFMIWLVAACGVFFAALHLVAAASVAAASVTIVAKTERTDQGAQYFLPGAERSARQAAAARGAKMRPKKPQLPPGGLFEGAAVGVMTLTSWAALQHTTHSNGSQVWKSGVQACDFIQWYSGGDK